MQARTSTSEFRKKETLSALETLLTSAGPAGDNQLYIQRNSMSHYSHVNHGAVIL